MKHPETFCFSRGRIGFENPHPQQPIFIILSPNVSEQINLSWTKIKLNSAGVTQPGRVSDLVEMTREGQN